MDLWDVVTPLDLTTFARTLPDEYGNTLSAVLPDRTINGIKSRSTRVTRRNVTAKYRAYNAETPIGERPIAVDVTDVLLPPLGQLLVLTEWEQLLSYMASNGNLPLERIVEQIYDDTEHNVAAIRNRVELARGDFLVDGKFTLSAENGLTIEYDAQLPGTHSYSVATTWSNPAAPILTNELTMVSLIKTDARGARPRWQLQSEVITNYMRTNDEYRSAFWGGNASSQPNLNLAQMNEVRVNNGLPVIVENDHQLEVGGVNTRVLPSDRVIMVTDGVGEVQWGTTAESLSLVTSNAIDFASSDAPGITALAWKRPNPFTGYTQGAAVAMPVAGDINGLVSVKVIL